MTRVIPFTQAQIRRAVRGAEAAGLRVIGVIVKPDGSIKVETKDTINVAATVDNVEIRL